MVQINIPLIKHKEIYSGDGVISSFTLDAIPLNIEVIVSGIYLTEHEDYEISSNVITFTEVPLLDENINIIYDI